MTVQLAARYQYLHAKDRMSRPTSSLAQMEASLRRQLKELRGDVTLRDWIDLLIKETGWGIREDGGKVSPNTIRAYEPGARESPVPVDYIIAVGILRNKNPFFLATGEGPEAWDPAAGSGGAVMAAAQILENVVRLLRSGALPPTLVEGTLPPAMGRELGDALETLIRLGEQSTSRRADQG
jgi:hypothetical protein